jgi:choline-sulfatase
MQLQEAPPPDPQPIHRARPGVGVWLTAVSMCLVAACSSAPPPNILFIVIDTLRADHLDWYDTNRQLTPFLESLATHGNIFWNAYATSSWTSPSMASLWTSRYQSQHRVTMFRSVLGDTERLLPEILREHGYITGGFSANPRMSAQFGFGQGFAQYEVYPKDATMPHGKMYKEPAEHLNADSLAWLDTLPTGKGAQPVFLYLQYMEPHAPYLAPQDSTDRIFARRPNHVQEQGMLAHMLFVDRTLWDHPQGLSLDVVGALYDAEVLTIDERLRELFAQLEARHFLEHALVVITADHGEELMDHGDMNHGKTLYNEVIHVPLLFVLPGQSGRADIREVVSLLDVAPTVLDLAGIASPTSFEGRSLQPAMRRARQRTGVMSFVEAPFRKAADRVTAAYSELLVRFDNAGPPTHTRSLVVGSHKLVVDPSGVATFYDLDTDRDEKRPAVLTESDRHALEETMATIAERAARNVSPARTAAIDEQTRERMRALGYAE